MTQFYLPPWVAGYIPVVCPPKDSHPSQYLLTNIVVAEIELITIELQVRRPNDIVNELNQSVNEKKSIHIAPLLAIHIAPLWRSSQQKWTYLSKEVQMRLQTSTASVVSIGIALLAPVVITLRFAHC